MVFAGEFFEIYELCFLKGWMFYLEFNVRLLLTMMTQKLDIIYCVDADTLLAGGGCKSQRNKILVYDSHEWFTEVPGEGTGIG